MQIGSWQGTEDLNETYASIRTLGLESNLAELEAYGFTVLERLLPDDTLATARQAILDLAEKQTGRKPNLETGDEHPNWRLIPYLMPRHEVFQDILLNEKALALVHYLVGKSCQLSSMTCHFKGPGPGGELPLHTDTLMPAPLPMYSNVCNVNYAMVDYTRAGGCLAVVPASHKLARNPSPSESRLTGERANSLAIPVEVPAGSAVIWHGNEWHGSYPRTIAGLRLNLAVYFARPWMKVQERYGRELPDEVVKRHANNPVFRQLAGLNDVMGWKEEGPSFLDPIEGPKSDRPGLVNRRGAAASWHS